MADSAIWIGISGWRYAPWRGVFYPPGLPQAEELTYASRQVPTIEINSTFYSLQTPERFANWRAVTPPGFIFSVKGPRLITHVRRLKDVQEPLAHFLTSGIFALGEKLGPILWQLPPSLRYEPGRLEEFLKLLPRETQAAERLASRTDLNAGPSRPIRHALEIRHESFICSEFPELLRHYGVALVTADTAGKWPLLEDETADFAYLRLHGDQELYASGYTEESLQRWAARINTRSQGQQPQDARCAGPLQASGRRRDVYCYFDNSIKVMAPRDARSLLRKLHLPIEPTVSTTPPLATEPTVEPNPA